MREECCSDDETLHCRIISSGEAEAKVQGKVYFEDPEFFFLVGGASESESSDDRFLEAPLEVEDERSTYSSSSSGVIFLRMA